jgi:competence protein ComEA
VARDRTFWLALVVLALAGAGTFAALRWPTAAPAIDCPPEQVGWVDAGTGWIARCGAGGAPVPAGVKLTLGGTLDLNQVAEADLVLIPGIGPSLARTLLAQRERLGAFSDWAEVEAVRGIGPSKLAALQAHAHLGAPADGGRP